MLKVLDDQPSSGFLPPTGVLYIFLLSIILLVRSLLLRPNNPPGPFGWPIVGNILQFSVRGSWEFLASFKKTYGDLVFFHGLGNSILVLNSYDAMNDLLDKRGQIYSERPLFTVAGDLMGADQTMIFMSYSDKWREQRRMARAGLSSSSVRKYYGLLESLAAELCSDMIEKPSDFFSCVRLTAGRIVIELTYGVKVASARDEYITDGEDVTERVGRAAVPGAYLCDLIPAMKYLPSWVSFRKEASDVRVLVERCASRPFERARSNISEGIASPSLVKDLLMSDMARTSDFTDNVKWTAGSLFGAGTETTYASVLTFIMAMALHPEKQRLAHAEIDSVIGSDRLPQLEDRDDLPYLNAVIKEVARWHPVVPLSVARRTATDDWYRGFFIPKGTIIVPNVWAIAFSEDDRYKPEAFIPERFLDNDPLQVDPASWQFGFGRRICPGKALAENSIFILVASLIWTFTFAVDESEGLVPHFTENLVSYPKPFKCAILPRSPKRTSRVQATVASRSGNNSY